MSENSEIQSVDALLRARSHHMDSLNRLRQASRQWDVETTARGEATMANLMDQVYEIDGLLVSAPSTTTK